ncbi:hypothetical protein FWD07_00595 [Candidatus Saccharibacteria bacterium]|nr:hypothetical protein [Candidatus Saccharibacteria bacterium]
MIAPKRRNDFFCDKLPQIASEAINEHMGRSTSPSSFTVIESNDTICSGPSFRFDICSGITNCTDQQRAAAMDEIVTAIAAFWKDAWSTDIDITVSYTERPSVGCHRRNGEQRTWPKPNWLLEQ